MLGKVSLLKYLPTPISTLYTLIHTTFTKEMTIYIIQLSLPITALPFVGTEHMKTPNLSVHLFIGYYIKFTIATYWTDFGITIVLPCFISSRKLLQKVCTTTAYTKMSITAREMTDLTHKLFKTIIRASQISITLLSILSTVYERVNATLLIQMSPCRSGYVFDKLQLQCICYPYSDIVHCNVGGLSEIKAGYWVGFIFNKYTSSICPNNYCKFAKHFETSPGYFELAGDVNDQCTSHRMGVACGECCEGHTLAYDTPNCISTCK